MPELPEVETSRRGISPHLLGQTITAAIVRQHQLRWPIPDLCSILPGQTIRQISRRAKYLLLQLDSGTLIIHLGMSGSLRVLPADTTPGKHDHFDLCIGRQCLRLHDPRRFGAVLWTGHAVQEHPLIRHLGPEPLSNAFHGDYLYQQARMRKIAIKNLIMDGKVVVGVGNIYATESLFLAGIHPQRACNRIARTRIDTLVGHIKVILTRAIRQGGTTLRDFQHEDGKPGYFAQELLVYGREGLPCPQCGQALLNKRIGQRSSVYCRYCQK